MQLFRLSAQCHCRSTTRAVLVEIDPFQYERHSRDDRVLQSWVSAMTMKRTPAWCHSIGTVECAGHCAGEYACT
jgi:hypothetical protein